MSCCGSCAHGRKCEGKKKRRNPMTRKEAARVLSVARRHRWISKGYAKYKGSAKSPVARLHEGYYQGMRDAVRMTIDRGPARRRNPNFLYLANGRRGRRRRNPASNTWIYQANGKKRTRRMKIRGRKRPSQRYKAYLAARGRPFRYVKSKRRS